jgi:hypothetical protein
MLFKEGTIILSEVEMDFFAQLLERGKIPQEGPGNSRSALCPSRGRWKALAGLLVLGLLLLQGCGNTSSTSSVSPGSVATSQVDPYSTAVQAYIWGYPLVYNTNKLSVITPLTQPAIKNNTLPMAPINQICYLSHFVTPDERVIPGPNLDSLYGVAWFDLSTEPVVIRVPTISSRYWIFQCMDMYTNVFASPGSRRGSSAGTYLLVGPDWNGTVPSNIVQVLRATTHQGCILSRVGCKGQADAPNVLPILNNITMCPLSQAGTFPAYVDYASVTQVTGPNTTPDWTPDNTYWDTLRTAITQVEVPADQQQMVASFQSVLNSTDPMMTQVLAQALKDGKQTVANAGYVPTLGQTIGNAGWRICRIGGCFGNDFLTCAGVQHSIPYYNLIEDAAYFTQGYGNDGNLLDGSKNYTIHISKDQLPPINTPGFWSLTLYDADLFLVPNSVSQYNLGTNTPQLQYNSDGSVDIYLQSMAPTGHESNWLPMTAAGNYLLILRVYEPGSTVLDGIYVPPAVMVTTGK